MSIDPDLAIEMRAARRVGSTLKGKWKLDRLVGMGGVAAVYSATHRNGSRVAVKVLHPEISIDQDLKGRFLREGYIANSIQHPGVVRVSDDDTTDDGAAFIVMDLLEGATMEEVSDRLLGRLSARHALEIAHAVLDVLAASHAGGVIHRDVKPSNVFLETSGRIRLLDFGIARASGSTMATQTGSAMGTPAFMAPEQAKGRWNDVDHRSDLYGVGAMLFTVLTGHLVHDAETIPEMLAKVITQPARSILTVMPGAPQPLVALVDRALAHDRTHRWPDARTMQRAVENAYHAVLGVPLAEAHRANLPGDSLGQLVATGVTRAPVSRSAEKMGTLAKASMSGGSQPTGAATKPTSLRTVLTVAAVVFVVATVGGIFVVRSFQKPEEKSTAARPDSPVATAESASPPTVAPVETIAPVNAAAPTTEPTAPATAPPDESAAPDASAAPSAPPKASSTPTTKPSTSPQAPSTKPTTKPSAKPPPPASSSWLDRPD